MEIQGLQALYAGHKSVKALVKALQDGSARTIFAEGLCASAAPLLFSSVAAACPQVMACPYVFVLDDAEEAGYFYHDLTQILGEQEVFYFPSSFRRAVKFGQRDAANEILRTEVISRLSAGHRPLFVVTYPEAVMEKVVSRQKLNEQTLRLRAGERVDITFVEETLRAFGFRRVDYVYEPGQFAVRGSILDVFSFSSEWPYRVDFFGDEVDRISEFNPLTGEIKADLKHIAIYPASHYIVPKEKMKEAIQEIEQELEERLAYFRREGKLLEAQRIEQRTRYDIEMLQEIGFCKGIENYSRVMAGREPGSAPFTLLDYFPKDYLLFVDESHVTLPQVRAMYNGDHARKDSLVKYGFRLPWAYDNRPLKFEEFEERIGQAVFVSATPGPYERERADQVVEQVIRPTGLLDPRVEVRPVTGQIDDLMDEIRARAARDERVLVTTLTKKMAEDLTEYLKHAGIRVRYMHSDVQTIERMEIIRSLRLGEFDVLVGINLLREGLDLPEVSLVAILDADKEGFLRSETSLIQTIGRAARNADGLVIMYADEITPSMRAAIDETERRRSIQDTYNQEHGIVPKTIIKGVREILEISKTAEEDTLRAHKKRKLTEQERAAEIAKLEKEMREASKMLEFEYAAVLRDRIIELRKENTK